MKGTYQFKFHCHLKRKKKQTVKWGCPHSVMVKVTGCRIIVSEFELQSCHYIHFRTNTLGKGMNLLILPAMG